MAQMTGADIGDLESGAARLESVGSQIGGMRRPLRSQLYSSYWEGRAAERFRSQWDTVHGPALSNAEDFLRSAGQRLRTEADEQRRASNMGGGGRGSELPTDPVSKSQEGDGPLSERDIERLRDLLDRLGIPLGELSKWIGIVELFAKTPAFNLDQLFGPLEALSSFRALSDVAGKASKVLNIAGYALDYLQALGDHSELPFDEMVVAASATVGVAFALDAGVEAASKFLGSAVASAAVAGTVTAPIAPLLGWLTSRLTGAALGTVVDFADDQLGVTDTAVEATLDVYRYAKEHDFNLVDMGVDAVGDAAEAVLDAGTDFVGDRIDDLQDVGDAVAGFFGF